MTKAELDIVITLSQRITLTEDLLADLKAAKRLVLETNEDHIATIGGEEFELIHHALIGGIGAELNKLQDEFKRIRIEFPLGG